MYLAFDTETTGLDYVNSNLLTAYFIILDDSLNIIDTLDLKLQYPVYNITIKALTINKINIIEHDSNSITIEEAKIKFLKFLNKNKGKYRYTPIGHNINFDINFIKNSGIITEYDYSNLISCNVIDTITIGQFLKFTDHINNNQSLSLVNLCKMANINVEGNSHEAKTDILMTIELLKYYKNIIKTPSEDFSKKRKFV
jgi:oligoribonuclease (3'-5' exoribonuclease)